MDISKDKNWFLFFGVGILWAIVSSRKVYAPNINNKTSAPLPTLDPNRAISSQNDCSLGTYYSEYRCLTSDQIIAERESQKRKKFSDAIKKIMDAKQFLHSDAPQSLADAPQSQADCGAGLVFNSRYPCGIPGCDWIKECITPEEKAMRDAAPPPPSSRPMGFSGFTGINNEHQPGNFLTDDPGDIQSMEDFINDVP